MLRLETLNRFKSEKIKKPLLVFTALLTIYALSGYLLLPWLIKTRLPDFVRQQTGQTASTGLVRFDPFSLQLIIKNFTLDESNGQNIARIKQIYVNLDLFSCLRYGALAIDKIYLQQPILHIVRDQQGNLNLAKLIPPNDEPATTSGAIFPLWLGKIRIADASLDFLDMSLPANYSKRIKHLYLNIGQLATVSIDEPREDSLSLEFADGGTLSWRGEIRLTPAPDIQGHITLKAFNSEIFWQYLSRQTGFNIKQGQWDMSTDVAYRIADDNSETLSMSNSQVRLSNVLDDGGLLEWHGRIDILPRFRSNGSVQIKAVQLEKLWPYIGKDLPFELNQGLLNAATDYTLQSHNTELSLSLQHGRLKLRNIFTPEDSIRWQGDATLFPQLKSSGKLTARQLDLHQIWQHTRQHFDYAVQQGQLSFDVNYVFHKHDQSPQMQLNQGHIQIEQLRLSANASGQPLVSIKDADIEGLSLDLQKQQLRVDALYSDHGSIWARVDQQGHINLMEAFTGKTAAKTADQAKQATVETTTPWHITLANIELQNYSVDLLQETATKPIHLKLSPVRLSINDFSSAPQHSLQFTSNIGVNASGTLQAQGKMSLEPLTLTMHLKASDLPLRPLQPYLEQNTRLELVRGSLSFDSQLDLKQEPARQTRLDILAQAQINRLKTVEADNNKDFLQWRTLTFEDLHFSLNPLAVNISTLNLDNAIARIIINKDKTSNIASVFSRPPGKTPIRKTKSALAKRKPLALNIKTINIKNAAGFYADRSLILPFATQIDRLSGHIKNLSSEQNSQAMLRLQGKANRTAPLLIEGEIAPFRPAKYLNIRMHFDNINMTGMTPYMAEFAGYKVEKGKLSTDLHYQINNKQLQADNRIVIKQLTLGEAVASPNSVSLPVKLAVALLKDQNGVINVDLPLTGNLDDPEFSVFGMLGDVLLNLLNKTVTSPFSAIHQLLNVDTDLSRIRFAPGNAQLDEQQQKALDTLAQGLKLRPQLQLEIRGIAYRKEDGIGLAENTIDRHIKAIVWHHLDDDERPADMSNIPTRHEQYRGLLRELYQRKFPHAAEQLIEQAESLSDTDAIQAVYRKMLHQLADVNRAGDTELNQLAARRARAISAYLLEQAHTRPEQVYILGQNLYEQAKDNKISVELELGVPD